MKRIFFIGLSLAVCTLTGCKKDCPSTNNKDYPLFEFSADTLWADNASEASVKISIPAITSKDRRTLKIRVVNGTLKDAKDNEKDLVCSIDPDNPCMLSGKVNVVAPANAGWLKVLAQINDTEFADSIALVKAVPQKISFSANAFAVKCDFGSEITLIGKLTTAQNSPAGKGYPVKFEYNYPNGTPVPGQEREIKKVSDGNSQVSVIYSPGFVPFGSWFWAKATVCEPDGTTPLVPTVSDSVRIFIIEND